MRSPAPTTSVKARVRTVILRKANLWVQVRYNFYNCFYFIWNFDDIFVGHHKRHRPTTRSNYSPEVTKILMEWFENNLDNPYPCESDRIKMCRATGLTRKQLRVWLINARKVSFYS